MFGKKILVIDDTVLMQRMITDILRAENYAVIVAGSGEEGLLKVAQEKPDLVILDVSLPGIDGFEVCKILSDNESNNLMPIIMTTSHGDEEDKLKGLELGADDYIIKPFNPRELLSRIRNTLKRIDRNRLANPLTGLHGNLEIQAEIMRRLEKNEVFSLIYTDLDNFKAYNDVYGFACGDSVIKLTADIIADNVLLYGSDDDFLGHIGGDDFIIITKPVNVDDICKGIISEFDSKVLWLYSEKDREKGYIETADRRGSIRKYPIMAISIAVVSNEHRHFENHVRVAEAAAEVKMKAKSIPGSVYVKDRRRQ
ncbi:MAG TPA: response regulator [Clostridiaceae bacterium]|nr:response regulator [Clostridiaceae bacterium]